MKSLFKFSTCMLLAAGLLACASTQAAKYPDTTAEGLTRIKSKKVDALYVKEGASLEGYKRFNLLPCEVSFRKDWQRDQNRERFSDPSSRVTDDDMTRIRTSLSQLFSEQFAEALVKAGYQLTNDRDEDVLVLDPSIVDLDVNAPDVSRHQVGMVTTYTAETGRATLSLDFHDGLTNELFARAIDRQIADPAGRMQVSNSVMNRAEAITVIQRWAKKLTDALDEANGK
jgi:hypothetical protein